MITHLDHKKFTHKFRFKNFKSREGLYLFVRDDSNVEHTLEASPLLGFSDESIEDVKKEILQLKELLPISTDQLRNLKSASLHFAFYSLQYPQITEAHRINKQAALFVPEIDSIDDLLSKKPSCIKIKLDLRYYSQASSHIDLLSTIIDAIPDVKLRIDPNQLSNPNVLEQLLKHIPFANIDYFEEPFSDFKLYSFFNGLEHLVAFDESIRRHGIDKIDSTLFKVGVIKPMLDRHFVKNIETLKKRNQRVVISSSFETLIGMRQLKQLIHQTSIDEYHGTDTLKYFNFGVKDASSKLQMSSLITS